MALQPGPMGSKVVRSSPGPQGIAVAGPVGVDHSMELQPSPLESMVVHTFIQGLQTFAYVHPMFADVCILLALGSKVVHHAGPAPVDRSMALQPGPFGSIEGTASSPGPRGSRDGTPTNSPGIQGCASCWPIDPRLCILPALGSMVVHHAGPSIQGCASCWPMNPWLCILLAYGSMVVHTSGLWIHGCAYFRPWDLWLCIMLAHRSKVVHRVPARSSNQSRPPWNRSRELH